MNFDHSLLMLISDRRGSEINLNGQVRWLLRTSASVCSKIPCSRVSCLDRMTPSSFVPRVPNCALSPALLYAVWRIEWIRFSVAGRPPTVWTERPTCEVEGSVKFVIKSSAWISKCVGRAKSHPRSLAQPWPYLWVGYLRNFVLDFCKCWRIYTVSRRPKSNDIATSNNLFLVTIPRF